MAHVQDCFSRGGARLALDCGVMAGSARHGGRSFHIFFIGSPQHGQVTTWGGFTGGTGTVPMNKRRPV
jgi:hypothetical protein